VAVYCSPPFNHDPARVRWEWEVRDLLILEHHRARVARLVAERAAGIP